MVTISEVAKKANVSRATVSRYLNNGYVSKENREKIQKAIDELGYKVNTVAQALSKKSSKTIGLIVPSITNPFFPELARAVESDVSLKGYKLIICNSYGNVEKEENFIYMLEGMHANGIITATGNCREIYSKIKMPVVSIDRKLDSDFVHVCSDNHKGGQLAFNHLYECGCNKLVFVRPSSSFASVRDRQEGFLAAAGSKNYNVDIINIPDDESEELPIGFADRIQKYDGIFAWNDTTAVMILRMLHNKGVRVPENIMLVGFDDIYISKLFIPSITTVRQQIYEMGRKATKALMDIIEKGKTSERSIVLDVELIKRDTTA